MYFSPYTPEDEISVGYQISSGKPALSPSELYYCDTCHKLLSRFHLVEQIDSSYCVQCMESLPSTEALVYRNCCCRCFDCPICGNVLSYTPKSQSLKSQNTTLGEEEGTEKETSSLPPTFIYILSCGHCRWDSSHLGLEEGRVDRLTAKVLESIRSSPCSQKMSLTVEALKKCLGEQQRGAARVWPRAYRPFPGGAVDLYGAAGDDDFINRKKLGLEDGSSNAAPFGGPGGGKGRKWGDVEKLLERRAELMKAASIWDGILRGMEKEFKGGGRYGLGLKVDFNDNLVHLTPASQTRAESLIEELDNVDTAKAPRQRSLLFQSYRPPKTVDDLLPLPKPLLTKRSHRCAQCNRFVVRTQINPNAPLRLNCTAKSVLPHLTLIRVSSSAALSSSSLIPLEVVDRFPHIAAAGEEEGGGWFVDFEFLNIQEGTMKLSFDFSKQNLHKECTVEILTPNFETSVPGFDEYSEDVAGEGTDEKSSLAPAPTDNPDIIKERDRHKLQIRFEVKARQGAPRGSVARCCFEMTVVSTKMKNVRLVPVFVLGRLG